MKATVGTKRNEELLVGDLEYYTIRTLVQNGVPPRSSGGARFASH